jgi:hypothetical protein
MPEVIEKVAASSQSPVIMKVSGKMSFWERFFPYM